MGIICTIIFILNIDSDSYSLPIFGIAGFCLDCAGLYVYYRVDHVTISDLYKKNVEDLTPDERKIMIAHLERSYSAKMISFMEYDVLKAKYTGQKSVTSMVGIDVMRAADKKMTIDNAIKQNEKSANKRIIRNAVIGGAIGGVGGEIIGASTAINKINMEQQELLKEREKADTDYKEALKNYAKR